MMSSARTKTNRGNSSPSGGNAASPTIESRRKHTKRTPQQLHESTPSNHLEASKAMESIGDRKRKAERGRHVDVKRGAGAIVAPVYPVEPQVIQALPRRKHIANHSYRDFSCVPLDIDCIAKTEADVSEMTFSERIHFILSQEEYQDCMHWLPHGRSFVVSRPKEFEERIAEPFFSHKRYSTFLRQLTVHGFTAITRGTDRNSFYHECMLRGLPHLCKYMPPARDVRHRLPDPDNEPNFYAISEAFPVPDYPPLSISQKRPAISSVASNPTTSSSTHLFLGGSEASRAKMLSSVASARAQNPSSSESSPREEMTATTGRGINTTGGRYKNEPEIDEQDEDKPQQDSQFVVGRHCDYHSRAMRPQLPISNILESAPNWVHLPRAVPDQAAEGSGISGFGPGNLNLSSTGLNYMQDPAILSALLGHLSGTSAQGREEQQQHNVRPTLPFPLNLVIPLPASLPSPEQRLFGLLNMPAALAGRPSVRPQLQVPPTLVSSDTNVALVARLATELIHLLNQEQGPPLAPPKTKDKT